MFYSMVQEIQLPKMFMTVTLAASCVFLTVVYGITGNDEPERESLTQSPNKSTRKKKKRQLPPGPRGLPFFGIVFSADTKNLHKSFHQWKDEYGDVILTKLFGKNIVVLNTPEVIKKAFKSEEFAPFMSDRPLNFIGEKVLYNYKDVLLRRYDDEFKQSKQLMMKCMSKHGFGSKHFTDLANDEFKSVIEKFKVKEGENISPVDILMPSFCKMIGMMFSGKRLEDGGRLLECITDIDHYGDIMIRPTVHSVYKYFPWIRRCCGYFGNLYDRVMEGRESLFQMMIVDMKKSKDKTAVNCLVHEMMREQDTEAEWLTDEHINAMLIDLINTSVLTTKSVMAGFIFTWLHYPDVQKRIQDEIDNAIGPDKEPAYEDLYKMSYTHACIFELLRFQSHLPLTAAHANLSQEVEFEGYTIPKGSVIFGNLYTAHHDERFWKDPWEFKPERYLTENGQIVPPSHPARTNNLAFGVGERVCVGQDMAYQRMFLYTVHLLRSFEFQPLEGAPLPSHDPRQMVLSSPVLFPQDYVCRIVSR